MFIDASVFVAMIAREPEAQTFTNAILASERRLTSPIAVWEAAVAVGRLGKVSVEAGAQDVADVIEGSRIEVVPIGPEDAALALEAHARFGKGRHPARLNMGDCFAYACARRHRVPLLYKGDDFAQTDIEVAAS